MSESRRPAQMVGRTDRDEWLAAAARRRKRRTRRLAVVGTLTGVAVAAGLFVLDDGPRWSGMLDALGLTCGEYVQADGARTAARYFQPWEQHRAELESDFAQHSDAGESGEFVAAVEELADQLDVEPVLGGFRSWQPTAREFSAAAVGGDLLIGHHQEVWSGTDRVSVLDPESGQVSFSAEVLHPLRQQQYADEPRQPVLYGVGTSADHILLQTPTVSGDTDLVAYPRSRSGLSSEAAQDLQPQCTRLEGGVDVQLAERSQGYGLVWSQVLDLNVGRVDEDEFLILHGVTDDDSVNEISAVTLSNGDVGAAELPRRLQGGESAPELPEGLERLQDFDVQSLQRLGDEHLLLDWGHGYIVLRAE